MVNTGLNATKYRCHAAPLLPLKPGPGDRYRRHHRCSLVRVKTENDQREKELQKPQGKHKGHPSTTVVGSSSVAGQKTPIPQGTT